MFPGEARTRWNRWIELAMPMEHVHYLIEGAVSIASETAQLQTLYAYQETALFPLDEAGGKSHTVTAVMPSRVFRIVQTKLDQHSPVPPVAPSPPHPEPPH